MGKENYEERKQKRIERFKELAEKAKEESLQASKDSVSMVSGIPMGQPILVGHHSEKRHRRLLDKSWNKLGKSVELSEKAKYYEEKAIATENNQSISSDNPDAIELIQEKIAQLEQQQEWMKAINRICRSSKLSEIEIYEKLEKEFALSETAIKSLLNPVYSYQKKGFQTFELSNNNSNINRLKKRLKQLQAIENMKEETICIGTVRIFVNPSDNRVELYFPEKPSFDFRTLLKKSGFRWSSFKKAWQKHLSSWNIKDAKRIAEQYTS